MVGVDALSIIKVSDMRVAMDFYCSILVNRTSLSGQSVGPDYVGISLNGHQLHLSAFSGDGKAPATIYVYVDDVDLLMRICVRGLPCCRADKSTWGQREVYVRDRAATRFALITDRSSDMK
jgi:hypothetical protein